MQRGQPVQTPCSVRCGSHSCGEPHGCGLGASPCSVACPPHSIILSLRFSPIPRDKGLIWGPPVLSPLMKSRLQSSRSPLSFERAMDPQPGFRARCRHGMGTAPNEGCVPCSAAGDRGWQHVARVLCAPRSWSPFLPKLGATSESSSTPPVVVGTQDGTSSLLMVSNNTHVK